MMVMVMGVGVVGDGCWYDGDDDFTESLNFSRVMIVIADNSVICCCSKIRNYLTSWYQLTLMI